jgi:hypothetical protein
MDSRGLLVVFGSLSICVGAIVGGAMLRGPWGAFLLTAGIVATVVWVIAAFYLANAMNSDI